MSVMSNSVKCEFCMRCLRETKTKSIVFISFRGFVCSKQNGSPQVWHLMFCCYVGPSFWNKDIAPTVYNVLDVESVLHQQRPEKFRNAGANTCASTACKVVAETRAERQTVFCNHFLWREIDFH